MDVALGLQDDQIDLHAGELHESRHRLDPGLGGWCGRWR
jgi:hypothetical protein